jgi:crotonobetainyl-CoA:carnitine CoA-transferase CaiB-like acyl-CoA transferase
MDLFEKWPGAKVADHARANTELQAELRDIFAGRTSAEWIAFAHEHDTTIAPVNTPTTLLDDPQFADRLTWAGADQLGADQLLVPIVTGDEPTVPSRAPEIGEHTDEVLRDVCGYDDARIAELRNLGAVG